MEKIMKIYNDLKESNNELIESGNKIFPLGFIIEKDYKIKIVSLSFRNGMEKDFMREAFKAIVLNSETIGYVIILDTYMTTIDTITNEKEVYDTVIRNLYTPKKSILDFVKCKDNKIVEVMDMTGMEEGTDEWNFWGRRDRSKEFEKANADYQKFKKDNPDKYKELQNG